jgi:2,3-bisphosphoglycerate-dependent phosphoglycerate mutase
VAENAVRQAPMSAKADQRPALLVIVRHGQSERNTFDLHEGIDKLPENMARTPDHAAPLTEEGERQALATGAGLRKEFGHFDAIYHSPWLRTTQTAHLILRSFPEAPPIYRNLYLLEQNFGQLDPCLWPHRLDEYARAYALFEQQRAIMGRFYCRPPDGESWADVCMRSHQFLGVIFRPDHAGQRILIVTHGVTQQSFRYHLEHPTEEQLVEEYTQTPNRNCGTGAYDWSVEGGWALRCWNTTYY